MSIPVPPKNTLKILSIANGAVGAVLAISCLLPWVSLGILGSGNLFQLHGGLGAVVLLLGLALAAVSFLVAFMPQFQNKIVLPIVGICAAAVDLIIALYLLSEPMFMEMMSFGYVLALITSIAGVVLSVLMLMKMRRPAGGPDMPMPPTPPAQPMQ